VRQRNGGAPGPLVVSRSNPRYFTVASGKDAGRAVFLAGSHIWNNFHDGMGPGMDCSNDPERFEFDAYVDFLQERGRTTLRGIRSTPATM
jgi:hypothetical protein